MDPESQWRDLAEAMGHEFSDLTLLRDALTHKSFAHERPRQAPRDNERLEFLGDSLLCSVAARLLYERFPEATEGELTRRRADLVCESALADIATGLGLGARMRLGKGELGSGGGEKPRLLCSALEAVFAAVYLDAGYGAVEAVITGLMEPRLKRDSPGGRDYKGRLQERLQAEGQPPPGYRVSSEGPDHALVFTVQCEVDGKVFGEGRGRSKLEAQQLAAEAALEALSAGG